MKALSSVENLEKAKGDVYDERTKIITSVTNKINQLSIAKAPLQLSISGQCGSFLKVSVKTPDSYFEVFSGIFLSDTGKEILNHEMLLKRLKVLNEAEYFIEKLDLENLQNEVYLPFKELTSIKKRLLFILNNSRKFIDPIEVPHLKKQSVITRKTVLSVLISSKEDLQLCNNTSAIIYFQLPDCLKNRLQEFVDLFTKNSKLIPWFPTVLVGDDYSVAVELIQHLHPKYIVTDNTGIAYEAYKKGISWIAGPSLNIVNSYSLLCLKENFNCSGAFVSNEISKMQIKGIRCPDDFSLYYSIYHPIVLMTSRQCLFHQVTGCIKNRIDESCIPHCEKSSSITNLKNDTFIIEKTKGNYHRIYNEINYLNSEILTDFPDFFSGYMIDLKDIKTGTNIEMDKSGVIHLFENLIKGVADSKTELSLFIYPTGNVQYTKGI